MSRISYKQTGSIGFNRHIHIYLIINRERLGLPLNTTKFQWGALKLPSPADRIFQTIHIYSKKREGKFYLLSLIIWNNTVLQI